MENTDYYAEWFAKRWKEECEKFKEYTQGKTEETDGIWKPFSKWRKRYEKRRSTSRSAKCVSGGRVE